MKTPNPDGFAPSEGKSLTPNLLSDAEYEQLKAEVSSLRSEVARLCAELRQFD